MSTGLAACGTEAKKDEASETTISQIDTKNDQSSTNKNEGSEAKATDSKDSTKDSKKNTDEQNETSTDQSTDTQKTEKEITYEMNGKSVTEKATLSEKGPQGYTMYVLPAYSFTGEEPGKDILFDKKDGHNFMRIEVYPSSINPNDLRHAAEQQLRALSDKIETISDEKTPKQWEKPVILKVEKNPDIVKTYLFKQNDKYVKLTMFTKVDDNRLNSFLQMASTIQF
jgi:hypothetical protein